MKKMIIQRLTIISENEKKAKIVEFSSKINIITSQEVNGLSINRTGKSLIIKSIFHALGAKLSRYTSNWDKLGISTIIEFTISDEKFLMYRNGDKFIIEICGVEVYKSNTVSDLKEFYRKYFDFNIKLPTIKNPLPQYLYPGGVFLPFYIDQDIGWQGEWKSFSDIQFFKNWYKEILFFHTGIRPKRYYEILDEEAELSKTNKQNKQKFKTLETIYKEQIKRNKEFLDINIRMDDFKEEIDLLTGELNKQLVKKNELKDRLLELYDNRFELKENYNNACIILSEMEDDADYLQEEVNEAIITCPTCGTIHENDISNRFLFYQEIEKCRVIVDEYSRQLENLEVDMVNIESEIINSTDEIDTINNILTRKRNKIEFKDILKAEGALDILKKIKLDLDDLNEKIERADGKLKGYITEKSNISRKAKDKHKFFSDLLNMYLGELAVGDVDKSKIKKLGTKLKSGGNDAPTGVLAQLFAYYTMAQKYTTSVLGPIVFDAPLQQEPGTEKINLIFNFIKNRYPKDAQMIFATTELYEFKFDAKIINLEEERMLLNQNDYMKSQIEVKRLRELTLHM